MRSFGFSIQSPNKPDKFNLMNIIFSVVITLSFLAFVFLAKLHLFLFEKDKIDIFKGNLSQVAIYFIPIDKQITNFLVTLESIMKAYIQGDNVLITKEKEIESTWKYASQHKEYLKKLGFGNYTKIMDLLADLWLYKNDVFNLLGRKTSYNYLVILQNTNEKRPNGGFFGSFAFVTMEEGHIKNLEIVDSYYPDFIAYRTRIVAPDWTSAFLPDRKIGFIAGNKFGFTDIDGKNLKELYEKMFNETYDMGKVQKTMAPDLYEKLLHKYIKGVIFIRSDMIQEAIPGFQEKIREWQFLNACVDLIRGEQRGNKKEIYTQEVKDFFAKNKIAIMKNVVNNFGDITKKQGINIRLSNVSTGMQSILEKHTLTNTYKTGNIYAWDTNVSFDKVDAFVQKNSEILDAQGRVVLEQGEDIIDTHMLKPGKYTMNITYMLDVPDTYMNLMHRFEEKYKVTMTEREKGILAMQASKYEDPKYGIVWKWRETKSTIYFPPTATISKVQGDLFYQAQFTTPFAKGVFYQMGINENGKSKKVMIDFELK